MLKVYVAGKYSDDNVLAVLNNIRKGIQLCKDLFMMGYAPFCPWLDHMYVLVMNGYDMENLSVANFHEYSMEWLKVSDCVLVIPDRIETSNGVQNEIARAKELNIPIFYALCDLKSYQWEDARGLR